MCEREEEGQRGRYEGGREVVGVEVPTTVGGIGDSEKGHDERFGLQRGGYEEWEEWEEGGMDGDEVDGRRKRDWE